MGPQTIAIFGDRDLPERADTVVIGGGVIGVTTALFLAEADQSVALVEKGRIAGEQSSRNWGRCRRGAAPFRLERHFDGTTPRPVYAV